MAKRMHTPDPQAALTDELIRAHIAPGSRVIDLGCGDGRLLSTLRDSHDCHVTGVENDHRQFCAAVGRGIGMLELDLNSGLELLPDDSFDAAVVSQTLQQVARPLELLDEVFRVANRVLVVVPNFGHWKIRWQIFSTGRAPVTDSLPYEWYESPNVHVISMLDFRDLAARGTFKIMAELPIIGDKAVEKAWFANARAHSALYVLERAVRPAKKSIPRTIEPKPVMIQG